MSEFSLRFDMRASPQGASHQRLYAAALDMAVYAEANGFHSITFSEHHGVADGYLPSPMVLAAAIAGLTKHLRLDFKAIIAPLHDPLRLAEDLAVLDQISGGRVQATLAGGYNPREFAMFGKSLTDRGVFMEDIIGILTAAWTGEPFQYRGQRVRVTPLPVQQPRIPLLMGGSSVAAARRAGRLADGFVTHREDLYEVYAGEQDAAGVRGVLPGVYSHHQGSGGGMAADCASRIAGNELLRAMDCRIRFRRPLQAGVVGGGT